MPKTLLAQLIAKMEGFGIPNSVPTRHNNPGDLRHSPHSQHYVDPNGIGVIDTVEHGWEDLERQLKLFADRGLTLEQAIHIFAPPEENDTTHYLQFICEGLGLPAGAAISKALEIPAKNA